jgi:small subunit ribosomal protein S6
MRPYESLIIFDAELEEPAIAAVLDRTTELVRSGGGERGPIDRWGKRTFAYEIRHKREGYYVVMEFTAVPSVAAEIERVLHLADEVLRHKTIRLPDKIRKGNPAQTPATQAPVAQTPATRAPAPPAPVAEAPVAEAPVAEAQAAAPAEVDDAAEADGQAEAEGDATGASETD